MPTTYAPKSKSAILTSDNYEIRVENVTADDNGYKTGDILTYDGATYSKASLANDDNHTESFAVVYEDIDPDVTSGAIILLGGVRESLLSADYQALSDDDKKVVRKELNAKKIIVENI